MKVMLVGACFAGNMGGDAMYESFISQFKSKYPDGEIVILTKYPKDEVQICRKRGYEVYSFTTIERIGYGIPFWIMGSLLKGLKKPCNRYRNSAIRQYYECDAVVDFSGISFSDYRGFLDLIINATWFLPAFVSGIPIIKMSQSLGPYEKWSTLLFAKYCLRRISIIVARGSQSYKVTKELLPKKKAVFNLPDVAMCLTTCSDERKKELLSEIGIYSEKYVVIAPSVVVNERYGETGYGELFEKIIQLIINKTGLPIVFVPHTRNLSQAVGVDYSSDDIDVCEKIANRTMLKNVDIRIVKRKCNAKELKGIIESAELAIGSRYHFLIAAMSSGVPSVALGWGHKYKEMFELFGMEKFAFEYHDFNSYRIISAVEELIDNRDILRALMLKRLPEVKKMSARNGELVFRLLERGKEKK